MAKKENTQKQFDSLNINWYPGHMEKTRRQMEERLRAVDMIIELRDARMPNASINPILKELASGKPRLILLSKSDMADPIATKKWIEALKNENVACLAVDIMHDSSCAKKIIKEALLLMEKKREAKRAKGIRPRAIRAMACGIPNVGKSTMINRIARKNTVKAADKPGVTKSLTWIHADEELDVLDTPGVLWPKFDDEKIGIVLAALGSINDDILNKKSLAMDTIRIIQNHYPGYLEELYDAEKDANPNGILKALANKRNLKKENDELDTKRAAELFLYELRKGKLGRLTLEHAQESDQEVLE
ncbi:MAG: ribosome biogenesis GTPase YlqF [Solobacterium sp.]|nr:ribosome biogenesis GTPase YlqF [Solobacterium sp.]